MKDYAYLDKFGFLHIVNSEQRALENARNGVYVETDIPNELGYPITLEGEPIIARVTYGEGGSYTYDIDKHGDFPEVCALIEKLI